MVDLFGYTQTDNVMVDTKPTMVNQRPDMRAAQAFNDISNILQTGMKVYGSRQQEKQKDSLLEASKEANSLYDWYTSEINKTEDAYEKANILDQYKVGLDSIKTGAELSDENALTFDNATKRFVGSQQMAISELVKKRQVADVDEGTSELFKTMVSSPTNDVVKVMKDASQAYKFFGFSQKDISDKLFSLYASIKINGLQTNEAWASDIPTVKQELKDIAKQFDSKLIGKEAYTKFVGQLEKIQATQSQAQKDAITIFEHDDMFKHKLVEPKEVLNFYEKQGAKDANAKYILYKKDYDFVNNYDPVKTHPDSTNNPTLAKQRANLTINQALQTGDYLTALNVIDTTGEVGGLKASVVTGINSNDVNTLNSTANIVRKMFNLNPVAMVDKVLTDPQDRATAMYLAHVLETNGTINETDIALIDKAKQSTEKYPLSKEFLKDFTEDFGSTHGFLKNKDVAYAMAKMGIAEDKILEHFEAYYDKTIIKDVIDLSGVGNMPYDNDTIEEAFSSLLNDLKATTFTKPTLVYNPGTQTMWIANEGVIVEDTGIQVEGEGGLKDIIGGYVNQKVLFEEIEKIKAEEYSTDDEFGFSEANKANAYYDLFEKGGGLFNRFIDAFKAPFMAEGSNLTEEEVVKFNEQASEVYDKLKAKGFDESFLKQARKLLKLPGEETEDNTSEIWGKYYQTTNDEKKKNKFNEDVRKHYGKNKEFKKTIDEVLPAFTNEIEQLGYKQQQMTELLYKTALHESDGFKYKRQMKGGPAVSYLQVEPKTAYDNIHNGTALLGAKFENVTNTKVTELKRMSTKELSNLLYNNEKFAIAMAAVKYLRTIK